MSKKKDLSQKIFNAATKTKKAKYAIKAKKLKVLVG